MCVCVCVLWGVPKLLYGPERVSRDVLLTCIISAPVIESCTRLHLLCS